MPNETEPIDEGNGVQPPANGAGVDDKPKPGEPQPVTFTAEQQQAIDKIIGERMGRAKAKWEDELKTQEAEAKKIAEEEKLKAQAEWQKLAEQHETEVNDLKPQVQGMTKTLEDYRATVADMLTTRMETLGESAKNAVDNLPGEPDELGKLKWLNANEALFTPEPATPKGGTPPRGKKPPPSDPKLPNPAPEQYEPAIRF